jgi:hypothetical protein
VDDTDSRGYRGTCASRRLAECQAGTNKAHHIDTKALVCFEREPVLGISGIWVSATAARPARDSRKKPLGDRRHLCTTSILCFFVTFCSISRCLVFGRPLARESPPEITVARQRLQICHRFAGCVLFTVGYRKVELVTTLGPQGGQTQTERVLEDPLRLRSQRSKERPIDRPQAGGSGDPLQAWTPAPQ